jgi:Fur family transcriptional regulator, peroxide stress response regulator
MKRDISYYKAILERNGLRITPQRLAILESVNRLNNHPRAEQIIADIRRNHPNIATGTVYKVLDTLLENKLIRKVQTEAGVMRYDGILEQHHHLYCRENDKIEDYMNDELDDMLQEYFRKVKIPGFEIEDFKLQINGKYKGRRNRNE